MKSFIQVISVLALLILSLSGIYLSDQAEAKAGKKFTVKLTKCVDGDTAYFTKVGKTRFLYVDTPESTTQIEPYGKKAASYTCYKLKHAKKIELQFDGPKKDKYNRTLAWVWVDGKLLQKLLINNGYVEKFYDYGTYSYESELKVLQTKAKKSRVGLWSKKKISSTSKPKYSSVKTNFANCTDLRKVYPNGVPKSHPAYQSKMDRDQDGYACER